MNQKRGIANTICFRATVHPWEAKQYYWKSNVKKSIVEFWFVKHDHHALFPKMCENAMAGVKQ